MPWIIENEESIDAFWDDLQSLDLSDTMIEVGNRGKEAMQAQMDAEMGPDGATYAALSEKYAAYKARVRPGYKILRFNDTLYGDFSVDLEDATTVAISNSAPYASYLVEGTSKMPARSFMWLGADFEEEAGLVIGDAIYEKLSLDGQMDSSLWSAQ
jgi:phage gpG-like protein